MVPNPKESDKSSAQEYSDLERRIVKASQLLMNPPEVDVGTAPNEIVYQDGKMRLLHYLPVVDEPHPVPLLIIYALINKPYILDLQPNKSVIRKLLSAGFDVYMIDWGTPTDVDRYLNLDDYVNWYIDDVVDFIRMRHDLDSITVFGYCMGGTLSVMYTGIHPEKVRNFILMAAPLDFEADQGLLKKWSRPEYFDADELVETVGNVPGEFLNFGFLLLDPVNNLYSKYLKFIDKVDDEKFVSMFFRMEKWINDGIPLAGEAYREFIKKCYQQNLLVKNRFTINGHKVKLDNIRMPLLSIVAEYDHLVPKESSMSFNDLVPSRDKKMIMFPTGHIGLSVSSATHAKMWPGVIEWLAKRSYIKEPKAKTTKTKNKTKKKTKKKGKK
ncbi:MAG: class III poly(R)-hydroxyalkanoic acid synthase subunit PhaC [Thermoplasmata archaeon]|nr:MAG: class III poly(R)-hydroxyalkanoic acid synthase subunit PhaC [Thermoplasmata archaeon]